MSNYLNATICNNGHVSSFKKDAYTKFCKECGEGTVSKCLNCETNIHGIIDDPFNFTIEKYKTPSYCHECGKPYPWTENILESAVELIALDDELSDDYKEIIKNAIPDIITDTINTPVAVAKYNKVIKNASEQIQNGLKTLLFNLISEATKQALFR